MMNLNLTGQKALALGVVLLGGFGVAIVTSTPARSQLSVAKNYVMVQPTLPGTAQSGHANLSGTIRAAEFEGGGLGISSLNSNALSLPMARAFNLSSTTQGVLDITNTSATVGSMGVRGVAQASGGIGVAGTATGLNAVGMFALATQPTGIGIQAQAPPAGFAGRFDGRTWTSGFASFGASLPSYAEANVGAGNPSALGAQGFAAVSGASGSPGYSFYHGATQTARITATSNSSLVLAFNGQNKAAFHSGGGLTLGSGSGSGGAYMLHVVGGISMIDTTIGNGQKPLTVQNSGGLSFSTDIKYGIQSYVGTQGTPEAFHYPLMSGASGATTQNRAVFAFANGAAPTNVGVFGSASDAVTNWAGYFQGNVFASSASSGVKAFLIDHPLDPENKYLEHSSIESNERMNLYRGQVETNGDGYAEVTVPQWFSALNGDVQYQLTVVDESDSAEFVQAKVVRRLQNGRFRIRTSAPNTVVNWQLSGVRIDPVSRSMPLQVERQKPAHERGKLLFPEAYGYESKDSVVAGPEHTPVSANAKAAPIKGR